jgi:sugar phosphate isomerase/epimerase
MRKLGINYGAVRGMEPEVYIKTIAELGFKTSFFGGLIDLEEQDKITNLMAKYGIECENIHSPFGHINDIWLDTEGGEQMLKELLQSIDHCAHGGIPIDVIHMSSGNTPPPITDIGRARYETLVDYAMKKNVKIAFENLRKTANLAWAMETFNNDMIGFCWDCGHEACYQNGREFMPWYGERLICTHIHDNNGEKDADYHWLPFDGVVNFERFAKHIQNSGYQGPLTLEVTKFAPFTSYQEMTDEEYLIKCAEVIKKIAKMVDGE